MNELARAVGAVGGPAGKIAVIPQENAEAIVEAVITLLQGLGDVQLANPDAIRSQSKTAESSRDVRDLTDSIDRTVRKKNKLPS